MTNRLVRVVDTLTCPPARAHCRAHRSLANGIFESFLGRKGGRRCFVHRRPFLFQCLYDVAAEPVGQAFHVQFSRCKSEENDDDLRVGRGQLIAVS